MSLKEELIKLGYAQPELRDDLKPVIAGIDRTAGMLIKGSKSEFRKWVEEQEESHGGWNNPDSDNDELVKYDSLPKEFQKQVRERWKKNKNKEKKKKSSLEQSEMGMCSKYASQSLKSRLIKLGYEAPELREHLRPIIAEMDRTAGMIHTRFYFSPAMGRVQKLDDPVVVDDREKCPFCMKSLRGSTGSEIVSMDIEDMGSEGAHYSCVAGTKTASSAAHFKVYNRGDYSGDVQEVEDTLHGAGFSPDRVYADGNTIIVIFRGPDAYDDAADAVGRMARNYHVTKAFRGIY